MVMRILLNERIDTEMRRSIIIAAVTIILTALSGCAHKSNVYSDNNVTDRRNVYDDSTLINNYINRTNEEMAVITDGNSICKCIDTTTEIWKSNYGLNELISNVAGYEQYFNKKMPDCRMVNDTNSGYWPINVCNYYRVCDLYLGYLVKNALRNNVSILDDTVIVKAVDLWIADYMELFGSSYIVKSLPAWFQEYSDEDKIIFLEYASNRKCEFMSYQNIPCQRMIWQPYLWKENADSIKTILKQIMIKYKETHGQEMTELEMLKTEFMIQFGMPDFGGKHSNKQIPFCERCTDEELITVLKHIMQMNPSKYTFPDSIGKEVVRSLNQKKKQPMTAAEVIIAEFEIRYNRQIVCRQCTNEELLMVWKHFGVRMWRYPGMKRDSIPSTASDSLLRSLKEINEFSLCCLDSY
jgi:hypothetical protein